MNKFDRKRLNKIYEKVDTIAKQGKLGWVEYKEYLDEIIADGQYWIFQNMLSRKYGLRNSGAISIVEAKTEKIYDIIRFNTRSDFQNALKKLYDINNCYQIAKKVYSTDNYFLGEIYQESPNGPTKTQDVDTVIAIRGSNFIRYDDLTMPLIDKYRQAIEYLNE